ncbi:hypothetical protein [Halomonas sp. BC2]|uniref:hypothetical protein n=1 Tax=Halomonas sp. BC2 TaxID=1670449 RepID=UPI0009BD1DA8|nr:hypothetical protein [Halomonas sp. BC2]
MERFAVYRAVKEGAEIDDQPEWRVVDTRDENERDGELVRHRGATKPEADDVANTLNEQTHDEQP